VRRHYLQRFIDLHGKVRVCDLKVHHSEEWLEDGKKLRRHTQNKQWTHWGPSSRRVAVGVVTIALNGAVRQGYISENPLPRLERPPASSRASMQRAWTEPVHLG
jgi:hypothetical protein